MKKKIYIKEWMEIHPYKSQKATDLYFVELSNSIASKLELDKYPEDIIRKCALYLSAYLEDTISGLGLWNAFTTKCHELYGVNVPFYETDDNYIKGEINIEDIRFILWNTLYKSDSHSIPVNPMDEQIKKSSELVYELLSNEYEVAPENEELIHLFDDYTDIDEAREKLEWLFGHTYITEPSVRQFIKEIDKNDIFIIPTGPLALFLFEWIELITPGDGINRWKAIDGLFFSKPDIPETMREKNLDIYDKFIKGCNGNNIVYLNGYTELKSFLTDVLLWPDDESHTLPQMKEFQNFVLMCNREKGMLLAHDICQYINDPLNPYYDINQAQKGTFTLLTIPTKCPPDLLEYLIANNYIDQAQFPVYGEKELTNRYADFIARCSLLYYYRGD